MGAPFSSVSGALPRVTKPGYGRFRGNGVQRPNEPHRRKPLRTDPSRRPPAQSNGTLAVDAVADGNDGVKVAALYLVSELPEKICSSRICVANYPGLWYRFRGRLGNGDRSEPTAGVGSGPTQVKISSHSPRGRDRQGFQTDLPPPSTHRYARRLFFPADAQGETAGSDRAGFVAACHHDHQRFQCGRCRSQAACAWRPFA